MAAPSAEDLKKEIKGILKGADLDTLSAKKVRKILEEKFGTDLAQRKKEIDKMVMTLIDENDGAKSEDEDAKDEEENGLSDDVDGVESEEEVPKKKAKKSPAPKPAAAKSAKMDDEDLAKKLQDEESGLRCRRAAAPKPKKEREKDPEKKKKPSLYSRPCQLSDQLSAVVGTSEMPRSEVVKTLWSIVKERNLQDPKNKQYMLCDAQMETLFGLKRIKLFGMMKYLKKHITDQPR